MIPAFLKQATISAETGYNQVSTVGAEDDDDENDDASIHEKVQNDAAEQIDHPGGMNDPSDEMTTLTTTSATAEDTPSVSKTKRFLLSPFSLLFSTAQNSESSRNNKKQQQPVNDSLGVFSSLVCHEAYFEFNLFENGRCFDLTYRYESVRSLPTEFFRHLVDDICQELTLHNNNTSGNNHSTSQIQEGCIRLEEPNRESGGGYGELQQNEKEEYLLGLVKLSHALSQLPQLSKLTVKPTSVSSNIDLYYQGAACLLSEVSQLVELQFKFLAVDAVAGLVELSHSLRQLSHLEILHLTYWQVDTEEGAIQSALIRLPVLNEVHLHCRSIRRRRQTTNNNDIEDSLPFHPPSLRLLLLQPSVRTVSIEYGSLSPAHVDCLGDVLTNSRSRLDCLELEGCWLPDNFTTVLSDVFLSRRRRRIAKQQEQQSQPYTTTTERNDCSNVPLKRLLIHNNNNSGMRNNDNNGSIELVTLDRTNAMFKSSSSSAALIQDLSFSMPSPSFQNDGQEIMTTCKNWDGWEQLLCNMVETLVPPSADSQLHCLSIDSAIWTRTMQRVVRSALIRGLPSLLLDGLTSPTALLQAVSCLVPENDQIDRITKQPQQDSSSGHPDVGGEEGGDRLDEEEERHGLNLLETVRNDTPIDSSTEQAHVGTEQIQASTTADDVVVGNHAEDDRPDFIMTPTNQTKSLWLGGGCSDNSSDGSAAAVERLDGAFILSLVGATITQSSWWDSLQELTLNFTFSHCRYLSTVTNFVRCMTRACGNLQSMTIDFHSSSEYYRDPEKSNNSSLRWLEASDLIQALQSNFSLQQFALSGVQSLQVQDTSCNSGSSDADLATILPAVMKGIPAMNQAGRQYVLTDPNNKEKGVKVLQAVNHVESYHHQKDNNKATINNQVDGNNDANNNNNKRRRSKNGTGINSLDCLYIHIRENPYLCTNNNNNNNTPL